MNCNCYGNKDILSIPKGNDFVVKVCGSVLVPGMDDKDMDFHEVNDLKVCLVTWLGKREEVAFEIDEEGKDFTLTVPSEMQRLTLYSIVMTGTYDGHAWRWKAGDVFRIVDTNCQSSVQPMETYSVETYWVLDSLDVDVDGDTMILTSHGHADINDGVLILQEARPGCSG